ncbi:MAG: hypothetical protein PHY08_13960, partial [Candidatus Cloacimonetes bacterium]|nr:hypothetical protein [Candidatus Cloacimonadota bacterium]
TIKSILPKMLEIRKKEGLRGIYKLVENNPHGSIFDWNLHNITLIYELPNYKGQKINSVIETPLLKGRFGIGSKSKKASIHLATNNPINISSLNILALYFLKLIEPNYNYPLNIDNIVIRSIEFNKDYINLRLDGLKSITFTSLCYQYKLYQKKQGLRQEHKINLPINIPEIFSMLQGGNHNLEIYSELNSLKNEQKILVDSNRRIQELLLRRSSNKQC